MFVFTVTRNAGDDISVPITVSFAVGGTATYPTDYTVAGATSFSATTGSILIPAGQSSASFTAAPAPDLIIEADETIVLTPQAQAGVFAIGSGSAWTATITNDDGVAVAAVLNLNFEQLPPVDSTGKVITVNGGYSRSSNAYSGTYSGQFNGTNAWLLVDPSTAWNLASDITIECHVKPSSFASGTFYPNVQNLLHHGASSGPLGWALIVENQHLNFSNNDSYVVRGLHGMTTNSFFKIAYTKQLISAGNYYHRLFVNDVKIAEVSSSVGLYFDAARGLSIGCEEYATGAFFNGLIDDLIIYPTCLYT